MPRGRTKRYSKRHNPVPRRSSRASTRAATTGSKRVRTQPSTVTAATNAEANAQPRSASIPVEDTFKKMTCAKLNEALTKILKDDGYDEDLKKLKDAKIDGKLFLTLLDRRDRLQRLNLTVGGEAKIEEIIQGIKDGSLEFDHVDGQKPVEPDMPWCSTQTPDDPANGAGNGTTDTDSRMPSGWIPPGAVWPWKDYKEIYVKFLYADLLANWTIGDGQTMNTDTILLYANKWSEMGGGKIPRFVEAKHGETAQIRVSFNNEGIRNSHLGMRAQNIPVADPTMNLDLNSDCRSDDFKKHLIIHEFGHALGLGHEHQRSKFWSCIQAFTDTEEMRKDLKLTEEQFALNWKESGESEAGHPTEEYDPDSIMHYWFNVKWLKGGYSDKNNVEQDRDSGKLTDKQAKVLLGIHKRNHVLAKQPSPLDINLLKKVYGGADQPNKPDHESLLKQLKKHAARWKDIGRNLGFTEGELNNIDKDRDLLLQGPPGYLDTLLTQWLEWAPGDERGSKGYATLEGMKAALLQANLGATAHALHH